MSKTDASGIRNSMEERVFFDADQQVRGLHYKLQTLAA